MIDKYPVKIFWNEDEKCFYAIIDFEIDGFEGVLGCGLSKEEALNNLKLSIEETLKIRREEGWEISEPIIYKNDSFNMEKKKAV